MQDIEALTERILLIGKGRILLDGTLEELKKRHSSLKTLTVDYTGTSLPLCENYKVVKDGNGRGEILIDTGVITASQAISFISDHVEIKDISVTGETIDETVVSLYKELPYEKIHILFPHKVYRRASVPCRRLGGDCHPVCMGGTEHTYVPRLLRGRLQHLSHAF